MDWGTTVISVFIQNCVRYDDVLEIVFVNDIENGNVDMECGKNNI